MLGRQSGLTRGSRNNQALADVALIHRGFARGGTMETLLIIVVVVLLLGGGGWYGRGRWY